MGLLDMIKGALQGASKHVETGIDKAADVIDDQTGGAHTDTIQGAADKAKDIANKLDEG